MAPPTTNLQPSDWADLLPELLGRVIARLPFPDDLARFRAVCRTWHSAVREHACPEVPWIIHSDGTFVTTYDYVFHRRVPFPDNTRFIGANGSWLALYRTDDTNGGRRSYLLHNPFTKTTVPLPGLDSVIGKVSSRFKIRKVLMRSDQNDLVAVTTNSLNYPIILCRPGKPGAWIPEQHETQYASICDIAFHMGSLCGITLDKELVVLDLDEDDDGTPYVTCVGCAINYMPGDDEVYDEDDGEASDNEEEGELEYDDAPISDDEYEDDGEASDNEEEGEVEYDDASISDDEYEDDGEASSNDDKEEAYYIEAPLNLDAVDREAFGVNGEFEDGNGTTNSPKSEDNLFTNNDYEVSSDEDEGDISNVLNGVDDYEDNEDDSYYVGNGLMPREIHEEGHDECDGHGDGDGDMPPEPSDYIVTTRFLIESNGKLLMLKQRRHVLPSADSYSLEEEVWEADLDAGEWVSTDVAGALYVSDRHSMYVSALSEEEDELVWYFADDHDLMDPESQTSEEIIGSMSTWFFPQELVV
ncbi:unnamed protein product [Alopecurus aequalis]